MATQEEHLRQLRPPALKKGIDFRVLEPYFMALGGTVSRRRPDHRALRQGKSQKRR